MFFNLEPHRIIKQKKFKDGHLLLLYRASDSMWELIYLEGETILKSKCYIFGINKKVTQSAQSKARADFRSCINLIWAGCDLSQSTLI
jgi:hypothetical protein